MKIAIPVEADGEQIAVRMGYAASFSVYITDTGQVEKLGLHDNMHTHHKHGEGHHNEHGHQQGMDLEEVNEHRRDLGIVKECDAVIVRGIGPNLKGALQAEGIAIYRSRKALGDMADAIIQNFARSPEKFQKID